jgi:pimeloyl-ACP methyl ester carboxylesterase
LSALGEHFRAGRGEPVLLLHGFTATWRAWGPVLEQLADSHEVLAVTLPGHTGGPPLPEGDSLPLVLAGVEAMLDEVGWPQAHLVGFSLGGWLSFELAKRDRALTVTVVAPAGASTEHHDRETRRIRRLFARLHGAAKLSLPVAESLFRRPRIRRLAFRDQMVDGGRMRPHEAYDLMRAFVLTPVFRRFLRELGEGDFLQDLERVRVPVTVLWGERDHVLPQRLHEQFFRDRLRGASFRALPRAGHVPFWEATAPIVEAIRDRTGTRREAVGEPAEVH